MCDHQAAQNNIRKALEAAGSDITVLDLLDTLINDYRMDRDLAASALLDAPPDVVDLRFADNLVGLAR